ncbi:UNKNOWN [Stylonychia lemnae]|uniref:EF-hand domain-containing protein n=1 Tax=Stylonychia lemnae TaxID=5949 RepID=A0A078AWK0_STYLE|nr:UNKNOWN [Stylonychia lemnae]|eukprot:CDW85183.1 UNKNOWN [Stylonychia lemnae]
MNQMSPINYHNNNNSNHTTSLNNNQPDQYHFENSHNRSIASNSINISNSQKNEKLSQYLTLSQRNGDFLRIDDNYDENYSLIEINRGKFQKIFQLLSTSNNSRINFTDLQRFCKQVNIFPDLTNVGDLKKLVAGITFLNEKQQQFNNNAVYTYEQFEQILYELATQTLHLAKQKSERVRIFLLHIKNPCKMHYQIQNFTFEKSKQNISAVSKSISKIQSQNENNGASDNKSEKSLNFFINPQVNQKAMIQQQSANISPIRTYYNQGDQSSLDNMLNKSRTSRNGLHQDNNRGSFVSDNSRSQKSQIDENLELALKTLKFQQKLSHNNSSGNLSQQNSQSQQSKKDQIIQSLRQQIEHQKPKTARENSKPKNEMSGINNYLSPKQKDEYILVEETGSSGQGSGMKHSQSYPQIKPTEQTETENKQLITSQELNNNELQEFLEIENQIVKDTTIKSQPLSEENSMHVIVSPTQTKIQKLVENGHKAKNHKQKKDALNLFQKQQQETNFTFADNRRMSSTRNQGAKKFNLQDSIEAKNAYGATVEKLSANNNTTLSNQKASKNTTIQTITEKSTQSKKSQKREERDDTRSRERKDILSKNLKSSVRSEQKKSFSQSQQLQEQLNSQRSDSKSRQIATKVTFESKKKVPKYNDLLAQALNREEKRNNEKQKKLQTIHKNEKQIKRLFNIATNYHKRLTLSNINSYSNQKKQVKLGLRILFKYIQTKRDQQKLQVFKQLSACEDKKTKLKIVILKIVFGRISVEDKLLQNSKIQISKDIAFRKLRENSIMIENKSMKEQLKEMQRLIRENQRQADKLQRLEQLSNQFRSKIAEI